MEPRFERPGHQLHSRPSQAWLSHAGLHDPAQGLPPVRAPTSRGRYLSPIKRRRSSVAPLLGLDQQPQHHGVTEPVSDEASERTGPPIIIQVQSNQEDHGAIPFFSGPTVPSNSSPRFRLGNSNPRVHPLTTNEHQPSLPLEPASLGELRKKILPPLEHLGVDAGSLFPSFSPFIYSYDLLLPTNCSTIRFFPRCFSHSSAEALINSRSPFLPVVLRRREVHQSVLVSFKPSRTSDGDVSIAETLSQSTYIIHVRFRCSPVHKLKDCPFCRQDFFNSLSPFETTTDMLPAVFRPVNQLHFLPFVAIYSCSKSYEARSDSELSCHTGDVVAIKLTSSCGEWCLGHIVRLSDPNMLESRLYGAGWLPATCLQPSADAAPMSTGATHHCQLVFLATANRDAAGSREQVAHGTHVVVTLAGPQLSHFWGVAVAIADDGQVHPTGLHQWMRATDLTFNASQVVHCRMQATAESKDAVSECWASERSDLPFFFLASRGLFESSRMLSLDTGAFALVEGRLWRDTVRLPPVFDHTYDSASHKSLAGAINDSTVSGLLSDPPSYFEEHVKSTPPGAVLRPSVASITSVSEMPNRHVIFTLVIIGVQLLLLVVALADGGLQSSDNPLLGPSFVTLRRFGARWLPAIREGRVHLLLTPLFLPVGIVRFAIDMLLHLLLCWPVEARLGPLRTAAIYFAAGIASNITGCIFVPLWLVSGCGGALFGMAAAAAWLTLRRPALAAAPDPETGCARARPALLSRWRTVAVGLLLLCVLVLGAMPGCDNWTHMGGLCPGFLCAMAMDNQPVIPRRRREHHVLRATAAGLLCLLCLASVIIMAYVTDLDYPCSWCMRATCFNTRSWCSRDSRLGGP